MLQTMEMIRNPTTIQEITRNHDRALINLESLPSGYNVRQRIYRDFQELMLNVAHEQFGNNPLNTNFSSYSTANTSQVGTENTNLLPNPGASQNTTFQTDMNLRIYFGNYIILLCTVGITRSLILLSTTEAATVERTQKRHVAREVDDEYYYDEDVFDTEVSTDNTVLEGEYTDEMVGELTYNNDYHFETTSPVVDDESDRDTEHDNDVHENSAIKITTSNNEVDRSCKYEGQLLPVFSTEGNSPVCYKFKVCHKVNDTIEEQSVVCPFGLEWKHDTYECQPERESCRVERLKERSSTWLNYLLTCPSTSSLSSAEQSEIHKLSYYLAMNKSQAKQNNRHEDFLTPIIMELGIFRHVAGTCNAYFRCNYKEKSPFVHVLSSAIYQHCDDNKIFNQDWNRCMNIQDFEPYGRFKHTHPDPDQQCDIFA
ncbi:hypothetical protein GJ496_008127 [Pomphorhynchus laevis]|nr:hypothetical protein GJ496_008127 [Pomphorhynchus laevis]